MTKRHIVVTAVAVLSIVAVLKAAPPGAKEWNVNNADQMSYGVPYELYNRTTQIGYQDRRYGINLGWVGHAGGHFEFRREAPAGTTDHRTGPIGATEKVAIWSTKAQRYIAYEDRSFDEIDIGWSRTPVYQWRIEDQSASGGRVYFALYNTYTKKYMVSQRKQYGINLGWFENTASGPKTASVGLSSQQITQGWVPYLGTFGQNTRGNLLSVQNASQNGTLMFVKPGKSTNDCSDPAATVRVAPRANMTADQMKTLYSSATPRLPIAFLACLTTPTTQTVSLTFINITYKLD
jgi:hypothetical protein